jgi:hypothetical protein
VLLGIGLFIPEGASTHFTSIYIGVVVMYFVLTVMFVFVTFGYIKELEDERCKCAGYIGPDVIELLAWLKILTFVLALISVVMLMNGHNKVVTFTKKTPKIRG